MNQVRMARKEGVKYLLVSLNFPASALKSEVFWLSIWVLLHTVFTSSSGSSNFVFVSSKNESSSLQRPMEAIDKDLAFDLKHNRDFVPILIVDQS